VNSTINHRDLSPLAAIGMACDLLALGRADAILVGSADELSEPAEKGYRLFGAITQTAMRPYDEARDGSCLGEAASLVLLEREEDARRRGAKIRALVDGRAETGEDRPRIGWGRAPSWPEAARAVREAAAGRAISWVAGGGNGSRLDEPELDAIASGLGTLPPVSSILALTGESFSSGMLRLLAGVLALERQLLPGTAGLSQPLSRFADAIVRTPRAAAVEHVLVPSFSQGGANAALVLSRA
jgi:3-oxoacyl-[acyl-carrier-protein] synthase II